MIGARRADMIISNNADARSLNAPPAFGEIRKIVADALVKAGSGDEAASIWQQDPARIDLLLTDMVMPGSLNGRELAEKLVQERPGLKVVYTSGYSIDLVGPGRRPYASPRPARNHPPSRQLMPMAPAVRPAPRAPGVYAAGTAGRIRSGTV